MAVDQVDRLEEDKEHRPVDGLVKQGLFQGMLTFVGLALPLVAMYSAAFPPSPEVFWHCLPTAGKALAGPAAALAYIPLKKFGSALRARWFTSLFAAYINGGTILCWWRIGGGSDAISYMGSEQLLQLAIGVAVGLLIGFSESVWPYVCYKLQWIDSKDPPTPLSGPARPAGENPYADFEVSKRWMAHCIVAVRSINLVLLLPVADTLFFRLHLFHRAGELLGAPTPLSLASWQTAVACCCVGLLWASVGVNYRGEWLVRFAGGTAMTMLVVSGLGTQGDWPVAAAVAHMTRNAVGVFEAVALKRWYRWNA
eukprot:CAMPEP_0173379404 /NCGR_PEP_ID=MMETSP1356-20130122/2365_1 /TAXON_ID=77927 ORGANISM="Hemiselmis virescens, Strain PCC157" /NCGR_SAMPLE_ID=MMETSP1356 /ASSEMBLY_ACC=CAM_ASM_000847 /LENGTH=310 /DNA_ID=CAMNT_0014332735 /DNA_START=36 /DNA_END=968 /DNA_ORIENTATION=+